MENKLQKIKSLAIEVDNENRGIESEELLINTKGSNVDLRHQGILLGENNPYNFLFEGKNNEYDNEYKDYIS